MNDKSVSRRGFMKAVGIAGVGSLISGRSLAQSATTPTDSAAANPVQVPTRPFGKTGVKVSALALGGIFDISTNQLVLKRALDFGVTYWDTANSYNNGNSEKGIGLYLEKNPQVRKDIFLVTKAGGQHTPANLDRMLEESLRRMKTDYIDLYFVHGLRGGDDLTPEVKTWAEKAKASKKIRFFGFSSHGNMAQSLQAAAKAGWVDGIMLKYDYRLMHEDSMRAAMDACEKAGVGLAAMKTQGSGPIKMDSEADIKLGGHFVQRGFTEQQAKLKAVWENPQIATICSQMPNVTILSANVAACLDKTKLTAADYSALRQYATATTGGYCAGCTDRCEAAMDGAMAIGDVLRSLMYARNYGDMELARETLTKLPAVMRKQLEAMDYSEAERVCPNRIPIAKLMREAAQLMA